MLGGGSWCLVLPKAEGTCSTFPCLRCVATGAAELSSPRHSLYQDILAPWLAPATGRHPTPPSLSLLGFFPSQEGLWLDLGEGCRVLPHLQMAWEGQAAQLCNGTLSGMAGLQQFWLKKRWKIKESGRGYFWVLLIGTAKAGKGLTEQMKPVAITYKLVHYQCWTRKASYGWHLALTSYSCWVKA